MVGIIFNVMMLIATGVITVVYTRAYINTDKTLSWYKRLWEALKVSWVVIWNSIIVIVIGILDLVGYLADMLNAGAGDQLKAAVDPRYAAAVIVGILVISILARLRTLFKAGSS